MHTTRGGPRVGRPQMTYPDFDKALIHAVNLVLRRSPNLDYWDGESG